MIHRSLRFETVWRPEYYARDFYLIAEGYNPGDPEENVTSLTRYVAAPVTFEKVNPGEMSTAGPMLRLDGRQDKDFLQEMMDAAWNAGVRPSELNDLSSTLEATKYHLEDMRLLAKVRKV